MITSEHLYPRRYYAVLASMVGLTLLGPLVEQTWARLIVGALVITALVTTSLCVQRERRSSKLNVLLACLAAGMWASAFCTDLFPLNTIYYQMTSYAVILLFFANIGRIMLKDILTGEVTLNRICGAVCVFALIGFCFAVIHMSIALGNPKAYQDNSSQYEERKAAISSEQRYPLFVYFSFCTLSTVGYGDVVPVSRLARSCSCLEALCGQLYLTILVARLVGLHIASRPIHLVKNAEDNPRVMEISSRR